MSLGGNRDFRLSQKIKRERKRFLPGLAAKTTGSALLQRRSLLLLVVGGRDFLPYRIGPIGEQLNLRIGEAGVFVTPAVRRQRHRFIRKLVHHLLQFPGGAFLWERAKFREIEMLFPVFD